MSKPFDYLGQSSKASSTSSKTPSKDPDFTQFKALSFDVYGTLINWETGIFEALLERLNQTALESTLGASSLDDLRTSLLSLFHNLELTVQTRFPTLSYPGVLKEVFMLIAERLEIKVDDTQAISFGQTIAAWPAFKDTVAALKVLARHYKLIVLSNVSASGFAGTLRGPLYGAKFDAVYTAEEIGSYKPSLKNFEFLIKHAEQDFQVSKAEILHVANSLTHDHIPAKKIGLALGVWIERRGERSIMSGGAEIQDMLKRGEVELSARYRTLGLFAEAVEKQFKAKEQNLI